MTFPKRLCPFFLPRLLLMAAAVVLCSGTVIAQQTLGGITGQVADPTGSALQDVAVTILAEQTSLTRTSKNDDTGV